MRTFRVRTAAIIAAPVAAWIWLTPPTLQAQLPGQLPGVEPLHDSGQDVTPAFEGWFKNPDGTFDMLFGYNNRNLKEEVDIPIGPNNKIEPGNPDQGQPTHFMPRRGWGLFTVTVPKDFGTKKITWTLTHAGRTNAVPASLDSRWEVDALNEVTSGNTPPVIRFSEQGPTRQGPRPLMSTLTARMPSATLDVWGVDDGKSRSRNPRAPGLAYTWSKYRGPGDVTFSAAKPMVDKATGHATTQATFSAPGEYMLQVVANDTSGVGGGGFQCCWTNGIVKVTVAAGSATASAAAPAATGGKATTFLSQSQWSATLAEKGRATPVPALTDAPVIRSEKVNINVVHRSTPQGAIAHQVGSEIHAILEGSGTLVTDGELVGAQGARTINNGTTRHVAKGDIVLVPPGTPHWYSQIDGGSLTYLEIRFDVGAPSGKPAVFRSTADWQKTLRERGSASNAPLMFAANVDRGDKYQANVVARTKAQGGGAHEVGSEVHLILEGGGTFVTGGKAVRGTGAGAQGTIEGGDSRHVGVGDIAVVPVGTPHWYKEVDGNLKYLEVRFDAPLP
jgi:mannose-6-phosphate isomerase-like protein (cupin superfamily)